MIFNRKLFILNNYALIEETEFEVKEKFFEKKFMRENRYKIIGFDKPS